MELGSSTSYHINSQPKQSHDDPKQAQIHISHTAPHGLIDFDGLTSRYREELETNYNWEADFQDWLGSLKPEQDFTLLCFEPDGKPCHRRVAAAWLLEKIPCLMLGQLR